MEFLAWFEKDSPVFNLIFVSNSLVLDMDTPFSPHRQQSSHSLKVKCWKSSIPLGLLPWRRLAATRLVGCSTPNMHLGVFVKGQDRPERRNSYVNTAKMGKTNISGWSVVSVIFPPNSFPSVNLPLVCRLCSQTNLFSCKYFSIFPLHVPHFLQ